jgi:hypothetical protein
VSVNQLRKLITKIVDNYNTSKDKKSKPAVSIPSSSSLTKPTLSTLNAKPTFLAKAPSLTTPANSKAILNTIPEDLNKVPDSQLSDAKSKMEVVFQQNQKKPGDPDFEYDKRVELLFLFLKSQVNFKTTAQSDWDEGADEDFSMSDDDLNF